MNAKTEKARNRLIGQVFKTKRGGDCVVIDYKSATQVLVRFENGCERVVQYGALSLGNVKNYDKPLVQGFGILDMEKQNVRLMRFYILWCNVLKRCFNKKVKEKYPTYQDVSCTDRWKRFSTFVEDVESIENVDKGIFEGWHFDKDILKKGNKLYSKDFCCFVPKEVNKLFTKRQSGRGGNLIGVYYNKKRNKFSASCNFGSGQKYLGLYNTELEAFLVYKTAKEGYIKDVANKLKGVISDDVYNAMISYEVEIND